MKKLCVLCVLSLLFLVSTNSFASKYRYDDTTELQNTLARFDRCGDADQAQYEEFRNLVDLLDVQREKNRKPTVEVTDDNYYRVSLKDKQTNRSCDLHINPHDERCVRAECW